MIKWRETSNRKHFESFELNTPGLRINITNGHILDPGTWMLSCRELSISTFDLKAGSALVAKLNAVKEVRLRLMKMVNGLDEILKPEK